MESRPTVHSVESLQNQCIRQVVQSLECYSPELLCCIPPGLRYQIYLRLPIVDICSFEKTTAFDGVDHEALWAELYQCHWKRWDQWSSDEFITHRSLEMLPSSISNREKYFAFITMTIFCAERPSGYIQDLNIQSGVRCESLPEQVMNCYPTDIVNYLIAFDGNIAGYECETNMYDVINIYPIPQRELDNSVDDGRLSSNYSHVATRHQCIPQRFSTLVKAVSRLSDADALSLMMDKCNYTPEWIALSCRENIQWGLENGKLRELFTRFFCRLKEVHLNIIAEFDDERDDTVLTTCFASPTVSSLYLHLLSEVDHVYLSSEISNLSLRKLHISSPFDFTDPAVKDLTELLHQHKNICELEIGEMGECSFPDDPNFISNVAAIISNPQFSRFYFEGCEISSKAIVQLLFSFFSTICSHPQELSVNSGIAIASGDLKLQSPMSLSVCDSALQHKALKFDYCEGKLCSYLLSLKPLSLHSISLSFNCNSMQEVYDVLESIADNDRLQVENLALALLYIMNRDSLVSLPEAALTSILKRSALKSLTLDFKWKASALNSLTNALHAQIHLGSLEKLSLTFDKLETRENLCDLELLIDVIFNLPQISIFSFDFDIHLSDFRIIETIHKYWQAKKPKEFRFGHFVEMELPENVQIRIDQMKLVVKKELTSPTYKPCCEQTTNCLRLHK